MFMPWQVPMMGSACGCQPQMGRHRRKGRPMKMMVPIGQMPLAAVATGGFPVPEAISPHQFPPAVKASIMRNLEGPPKPAVTPHVMDQAQSSMIAPERPF